MISEKTEEEMEEYESYHNSLKKQNEFKDIVSPIQNSYNLHKLESDRSIDSSFNTQDEIK